MTKCLTPAEVEAFARNGYHFPIRALSPETARRYRDRLEAYERRTGGPISSNRRHKVHLLFDWANELIRNETILDAVEDVLGPNLLCWNVNFFIKEARDPGFVSWHQDATYWGLQPADVVTAWVALSDAPVESGAMKFIAGSHRWPQLEHRDTFHEHNLLSRGQEIAVDVDESKATLVPLRAGEFSLHHILLAHASEPNTTADRRIGFAIRYIPTHVRQLKVRDCATLVRGVDTHHHFEPEPVPAGDADEAAIAAHAEAVERNVRALYEGTEKTAFRA